MQKMNSQKLLYTYSWIIPFTLKDKGKFFNGTILEHAFPFQFSFTKFFYAFRKYKPFLIQKSVPVFVSWYYSYIWKNGLSCYLFQSALSKRVPAITRLVSSSFHLPSSVVVLSACLNARTVFLHCMNSIILWDLQASSLILSPVLSSRYSTSFIFLL